MKNTIKSFLGGLCALALGGCAIIPEGNVRTSDGKRNPIKVPTCEVYGFTANGKDYAVQRFPEEKTAKVQGYTLSRDAILPYYAIPIEGSTLTSSSDGYSTISNSDTIVFANVNVNNGSLEVNTNSTAKAGEIMDSRKVIPRTKAENIGSNASRTNIRKYNSNRQTTTLGKTDYEINRISGPVYVSTNSFNPEGFYLFQPTGKTEVTTKFDSTNATETTTREGFVYFALPGSLVEIPIPQTPTNTVAATNVPVAVTNTVPTTTVVR